MQVKSLSLPAGRKLLPVRAPALAAAASPSVARHLHDSSLNRALDVLGDWWTQRILRESFLGVRHFDVFQRHLEIPRQTLSVRLKELVANGILASADAQYRLTPRGLALYPWALMIWRWSQRWGGASGPRHPGRLRHLDCGHAMRPVFACAACREEVTLADVDYEERTVARQRAPAAPRGERRWTGDRFVVGGPQAQGNVAFITADRWTHLILGAAFLGCRTFDVLQRELGISSNILAQRLALLVDAGFLDKQRSADDARRFDYRLTPRSRDVFPLTIALVQWADRWLGPRRTPPMLRRHRACGQPLRALACCSHCAGELLARRVTFERLPKPVAST